MRYENDEISFSRFGGSMKRERKWEVLKNEQRTDLRIYEPLFRPRPLTTQTLREI